MARILVLLAPVLAMAHRVSIDASRKLESSQYVPDRTPEQIAMEAAAAREAAEAGHSLVESESEAEATSNRTDSEFCNRSTRTTCWIWNCESRRNAECHNHDCVCPIGQCARGWGNDKICRDIDLPFDGPP